MAGKAPTPERRQFCRALLGLSEHRLRRWWASIDSVAARMGIDSDKAMQLAVECERAGLVRRDLSQHSRDSEGKTDLAHSVILGENGWLLLRTGEAPGPHAASNNSLSSGPNRNVLVDHRAFVSESDGYYSDSQ